ncbi:hypothetical protein Sulfitobl28_31970 (plasmid) [Sulfitobacter pontiacus]|nr:hypothetical protein Sulfitobl28_31970 [Sulfitobacter pontiacus]
MTRFDHVAKWIRLGVILTAVSSVAAAGAEATWRVLGHDRVIPPIAKLRPPHKSPRHCPTLRLRWLLRRSALRKSRWQMLRRPQFRRP